MGTYPAFATTHVNILVVNKWSSYNTIIRRSTLATLDAVSSIYHLTLKFPIPMGLGNVKEDQGAARGCYYSDLKGESCQVVEKGLKTTSNTPVKLPQININLKLNNQDQKKLARPQVAESLEEVEVAPGKTVCISTALIGILRDTLIEFLVQHCTIFAWSHSNMEGIDPNNIVHQLSILPDAKPV